MANRIFNKEQYREYLNKDGIKNDFLQDYIRYDLDMLDINGFKLNDPLLKIKSQFQPYNEYRWIELKQMKQCNLHLKREKNINNVSVKGTFGTYINAEEIENILPQEKKCRWASNDLIECFLKEKKIPLYHNANFGPFFDNIYLGLIHLPPKEKFISKIGYYKAVFHEIAHATLPIYRRDKSTEPNNIEKYRREIIAELTSLAVINNFSGDNYSDSCILYIDYYKNRPEYKDSFKNDQNLILERAEETYNLIVSSEQLDLSFKTDSKHNKNDSVKKTSLKQ
jgi:hypothetical protein